MCMLQRCRVRSARAEHRPLASGEFDGVQITWYCGFIDDGDTVQLREFAAFSVVRVDIGADL